MLTPALHSRVGACIATAKMSSTAASVRANSSSSTIGSRGSLTHKSNGTQHTAALNDSNGSATSKTDAPITTPSSSTSTPPQWTLQEALIADSNRQTLHTLIKWSLALFVLPLTTMFGVYQVFRRTVYSHDHDTALAYSGLVAACCVPIIGILFGIFAYYDDDDPQTNSQSGVNWLHRDESKGKKQR